MITRILTAAVLATRIAGADPLDVLYPYEWVGNIDTTGFVEPSGLVVHPGRGTLFAVGDEGDIAEFQLDGTLVQQVRVGPRTDFEGLACDPATGLLYLAVEGSEALYEVDPDGLVVLRTFTVDRAVNGRTVLAEGSGGFEALTFVPGENLLVFSNQSFDRKSEDDMSALIEVDLPGANAPSVLPIRRHLPIAVPDVAGLHFDEHTGHFLALSDGSNSLSEIDRDGVVLWIKAFPGCNQEGLAFDGTHAYFAQDSGGLIKIRPLPAPTRPVTD